MYTLVIYVYVFTVSCPDLSDPASGQVQTSTDGSKSTAEFSCSSGYYLSGIARLTCELTGLWSDNVPTCGNYALVSFMWF